MSEKKLIVGLGNILLKDDGVGVRCTEYLRELNLAKHIVLLDGATLGYDLLEEMKGFDKVVLVDAVDMGKEPGHIASFSAARLLEISAGKKFSLHEIGVVDVVHLGSKLGYDLTKVRIVGIQPRDVSRGDLLSEEVERKLPELADKVLSEIAD